MGNDKINKAIEYYTIKLDGIVKFVNSSTHLTVEQIIESGEQLSILEYKLTALEVAKEN